MINQFTIQDYLNEARGRVTEQFKGKDVFDKYLELMLRGAVDIQEVLKQVQQQRSIDTAYGVNLDNIGEIVGQPRQQVAAEFFQYFGFQGGPSDVFGSFSSITDNSVGAPWYSLGAPTSRSRMPTDAEYRLIIKSKIIKNRTLATPEDVIAAYKFIFGASIVTLTEPLPAHVRIGIGKILSSVERGLLFNLDGLASLLPKTVGVSYEYFEFNADRVFALEGWPDAKGVGELNNPDVGGFLTNYSI